MIRALINDYLPVKQRDVVTHPCHGGLIKGTQGLIIYTASFQIKRVSHSMSFTKMTVLHLDQVNKLYVTFDAQILSLYGS